MTLYLECNMGIAGDMLMAALLDLIPDGDKALKRINSMGIPGVTVKADKVRKNGIAGSTVTVMVDGREEVSGAHAHSHGHNAHHHSHSHHHRGMEQILSIIQDLNASDFVRKNAEAVYKLLADAESAVHGVPVSEIHFHEVGTMDAIADIAACCALIEELAPDSIIASHVTTGFGQVECEHGVMPVPAPATAKLLTGIPTRRGDVEAELCTPTGAALLRHFVNFFPGDPEFTIKAVGYGFGKKEFETANCLRAFAVDSQSAKALEKVCELSCNLDDMTPEAVGFAMNTLFVAGALDVFCTSILMKKSRPGVKLSCICSAKDADKLASIMLKHTTTAGVRLGEHKRYRLETSIYKVETRYGSIRIKKYHGYGIEKYKPEFDDVAVAAKKHGVSFEDVSKTALSKAFKYIDSPKKL